MLRESDICGLWIREWFADSVDGERLICVGGSVGIRSQAWQISEQTTLGINLWKGLPIE